MISIVRFAPHLADLLPERLAVLASANLVVHPDIPRFVLHGSRGPAGGFLLDSDIEPGLAVIFAIHERGLECFDQPAWNPSQRTPVAPG